MAQLFSQTTGNGPSLVMLHGWAMHGGIFDRLARSLEQHFQVTRIDLPGHGRSQPIHSGDNAGEIFAAWTEALLDVAPDQAIWLGWSLGGQFAANVAAKHPDRARSLILMASNPQFVRDENWAHGMDPVYFEAFAKSVHNEYRRTLTRFLSLQTRGADHSREDLRHLKEALFEFGEPDHSSIYQGLELLRNLKTDDLLENITCPTLVLLGERDTLVPKLVGDTLFEHLSDAKLITLAGAGHAPFLSHEDEVTQAITRFVRHD
ncbi:MAG: pimeloyl-ACP methyl ester esterase BioH [Gammaproteobacteria bacterium]